MAKYINRLTDEEIQFFLNHNGYKLETDLTDSDGYPIDAIDRGPDDIIVRVKQINPNPIFNEFQKYLIKKAPNLAMMSAFATMNSCYGSNIDLIHISDYHLSKFCILPEDKEASEELCTSYFKYMIQKFPTYKQDLIDHIESLPNDEDEHIM